MAKLIGSSSAEVHERCFLSHTELNGDPIVFQHVKTDVNAMGMKSLKFGDDTLLRRMAIFIRITGSR